MGVKTQGGYKVEKLYFDPDTMVLCMHYINDFQVLHVAELQLNPETIEDNRSSSKFLC